jgi:hypothetical protein
MTGDEAVTHTDSEKGIHLKIKFRIEKVGLGDLYSPPLFPYTAACSIRIDLLSSRH